MAGAASAAQNGGSAGQAHGAFAGAGGAADLPAGCAIQAPEALACAPDCTAVVNKIRCPGQLAGVSAAGPNVGLEGDEDHLFTGGTAAGWQASASLPAPPARFTHAGDAPVLISLASDHVVIDPAPPGGPRGRIDVSLDRVGNAAVFGDSVVLLNRTDAALELVRIATGSVEREVIATSEAASDWYAEVLEGGQTPTVLLWGSAADDRWLYRDGVLTPLTSELTSERVRMGGVVLDSGSVVLGELLLGRVTVEGPEARFELGNSATMVCPANYVAYFPDVCGTPEPVPTVTVESTVVAAALTVVGDAAWLVAVVADAELGCKFIPGGCMETLPCDCVYNPETEYSAWRVQLIPLASPADRIEVPLEHPSSRLAVSATEDGRLVVALASQVYLDGNSDHVALDVLLVEP